MTPEMLSAIRTEVRRQMSVLFVGLAKNSTGKLEDIEEMIAGMPTLEERPICHPYGFVSRAKAKTPSLVSRRGDHPSNRAIIGHFDPERPELDAEGEVALYNAHGQLIYLKDGEVLIGSTDASKEAARKGDTIKFTVTSALAAAITSSPSGGPCSLSPGPPVEIEGEITSGSALVKVED